MSSNNVWDAMSPLDQTNPLFYQSSNFELASATYEYPYHDSLDYERLWTAMNSLTPCHDVDQSQMANVARKPASSSSLHWCMDYTCHQHVMPSYGGHHNHLGEKVDVQYGGCHTSTPTLSNETASMECSLAGISNPFFGECDVYNPLLDCSDTGTELESTRLNDEYVDNEAYNGGNTETDSTSAIDDLAPKNEPVMSPDLYGREHDYAVTESWRSDEGSYVGRFSGFNPPSSLPSSPLPSIGLSSYYNSFDIFASSLSSSSSPPSSPPSPHHDVDIASILSLANQHPVQHGPSVGPVAPSSKPKSSRRCAASKRQVAAVRRTVRRRRRSKQRLDQQQQQQQQNEQQQRPGQEKQEEKQPVQQHEQQQKKQEPPQKQKHEQPQVFDCVFNWAGCQYRFASKNEWKRHVSTQHLRLKNWHCQESDCAKVFNRQDLFRQHLRRIHRNGLDDEWSVNVLIAAACRNRCAAPSAMRCPVPACTTRLMDWDERMEHVAVHIRGAVAGTEPPVVYGGDADPSLTHWAASTSVGIVEREADGGWRLKSPRRTCN